MKHFQGTLAVALVLALAASGASAQTQTKQNRDNRQDARQDCRGAEGAMGQDKRDCKQDSRTDPAPAPATARLPQLRSSRRSPAADLLNPASGYKS